LEKDNSILKGILSSIKAHWPQSFKVRFIILMFLFLISAFLDILGLASFVPLILSLSSPVIISENEYFNLVYTSLEFSSNRSFFIAMITSIFFFFLFKNIYGVLVNRFQVKFTVDLSVVIANKQYLKYANLDYYNHTTIGSGKIINYVNNTPFTYITTIVTPLFNLLSETIAFVIITIGVAFIKPSLFLILCVLIGPLTILFYRSIRKKSQHIGFRIDELVPENINNINDSFKGFVELKLYDKLNFFREKFIDRQKEIQSLNGLSTLFTYMTPKVTELIAVFGVVFIFGFGIFTNLEFSELLSIIAVFAGAAYRLMPSLNRMIASFISLKKYQYTIVNLDLHSDIHSFKESDENNISFKEKIKFDKLDFKFQNSKAKILDGIDIEILKGERIGVIGSSGSGKTTFANLLLGLYRPIQGSIRIDDQILSQDNMKSWYKKVGYVKQDAFLMNDSLLNNITLGTNSVNEELLRQAIHSASLYEFINSLPDKLNSYVGENGSALSGGQRQRVAIARALYQGAEVLVFDEATSALDSETEKEINTAIEHLSKEITIVIIAHRITTLKECDRILKFEEGRVVGEYNYYELTAKG